MAIQFSVIPNISHILNTLLDTFHENCEKYGINKTGITDRIIKKLKNKKKSDDIHKQAELIRQIYLTIGFILEDMLEQHVNWRMQIQILEQLALTFDKIGFIFAEKFYESFK